VWHGSYIRSLGFDWPDHLALAHYSTARLLLYLFRRAAADPKSLATTCNMQPREHPWSSPFAYLPEVQKRGADPIMAVRSVLPDA
jgi:hypothetical protein